ncbi:MAG: Tol-Pal system beta propeller repeat protein TolB [Hyphomonadaceae bacterium]|nr:Tol-Pal system beta propeller repeat protein TolB [Hyphomonadaceae bacterium]
MRLLKFLFVAAAAVIGPLASAPAQAQLRVEVEGRNFAPVRIAVPEFDASGGGAADAARQIGEIIRQDLAGSAVFEIVDKASFIEKDLDISLTPRFPDWTVIDAKALVVGNVVVDANNNMTVQFRLYDVFGGQQQFATQYTVPTPLNWRRLAHKVADDIYAQLTGDAGYFDSRIVFVAESGPPTERKRRLAIMDQDGYSPEFLLGSKSSIITPRFSPSSQTIIYGSYEADPRNPRATLLRTYLYEIETGRVEVLAEGAGSSSYAARFSPDGRYVALSREVRGNSDIYVLELARRLPPRQLTTSPAIDTSPSFSPDGQMIVFVSDRGSGPQLYIMRVDGSPMSCPTGGTDNACRITFGDGQYTTPVWSPRGDWIAFTNQDSAGFYIGVIHPDGTAERRLTKSYQDEGPTWSPNGRVIAFAREAGPGAGPKLWSIDVTGRNLHRIPTPTDASDPAWSPILK